MPDNRWDFMRADASGYLCKLENNEYYSLKFPHALLNHFETIAFKDIIEKDLQTLTGTSQKLRLNDLRFDPEKIIYIPKGAFDLLNFDQKKKLLTPLIDRVTNNQKLDSFFKEVVDALAGNKTHSVSYSTIFENLDSNRHCLKYSLAKNSIRTEAQIEELVSKLNDIVGKPIFRFRATLDFQNYHDMILEVSSSDLLLELDSHRDALFEALVDRKRIITNKDIAYQGTIHGLELPNPQLGKK